MRISGAGCCLYDYLYKHISFNAQSFRDFLSITPGDGGVTPGELVFAENLSEYKNSSVESCIEQITNGQDPDTVNLGGPALVSLVHSAQMLPSEWEIILYSCLGDDAESKRLQKDMSGFSLHFHSNIAIGLPVPSTIVLSDPEWNEGSGERTFINTLGSAMAFSPDMIDDNFFNSDIFVWGGTALVPPLHDSLGTLTRKARERNGFNIVGTVYDFRNQATDPEGPWPLGTHEESAYPWIDILITDKEEAHRLSMTDSVADAADYFLGQGCGACIITQGNDRIYVKTGSDKFIPINGKKFPVSQWVNEDLRLHPEKRGDTTGCGDNFMGGIIVSIARQISKKTSELIDLEDSIIEGVSAGGFALYQMGGVYTETEQGYKKTRINEIKSHYREQIS
ncbi:carbohydrate kinase family protein [Oceanispirochaeta crateris]|nr:PfkB family carbohydrate kinase [Oceanispirochaeta crateris]